MDWANIHPRHIVHVKLVFLETLTVLVLAYVDIVHLLISFMTEYGGWMDVKAQQLRQHAARPYRCCKGFYLAFTSQCKQSVSLSLSK